MRLQDDPCKCLRVSCVEPALPGQCLAPIGRKMGLALLELTTRKPLGPLSLLTKRPAKGVRHRVGLDRTMPCMQTEAEIHITIKPRGRDLSFPSGLGLNLGVS